MDSLYFCLVMRPTGAEQARLAKLDVSKEELDALVMDYLVTEGHKQAAEELHKAAADAACCDDMTSTIIRCTSGDRHKTLRFPRRHHGAGAHSKCHTGITTSVRHSWRAMPATMTVTEGLWCGGEVQCHQCWSGNCAECSGWQRGEIYRAIEQAPTMILEYIARCGSLRVATMQSRRR